MKMLLATDGKKHSEKAVKYAFDLASSRKLPLHVVFVVSPKADEGQEKIANFGKGALEKLKKRGVQKGIKITTMLEVGSPYEKILETSDRVKADTIIVGTSGKTSIDRVLIGSVSEYVVRNSKCTVIVVK